MITIAGSRWKYFWR